MTSVYLLLWLADVVGNIGVIGSMCVFALVVMLVICGIAAACGEFHGEDISLAWRRARIWVWILALPALAATFRPDAKTIRLMAAANAAELAMASPLGDKTLKALNAVLDEVIAKAKK